eukprot:COSAG02_NODE_6755_length_3380_cov_231.039317_2_plen_363_part_00
MTRQSVHSVPQISYCNESTTVYIQLTGASPNRRWPERHVPTLHTRTTEHTHPCEQGWLYGRLTHARTTDRWRGTHQAYCSPTPHLRAHRVTPFAGRTHGAGVSFGASAQRLPIRAARGWGHSSGGGGGLGGLASAQGGREALTDSCCSAPSPPGWIPARLLLHERHFRCIPALTHRPSSVRSLHGANFESLALSLVQSYGSILHSTRLIGAKSACMRTLRAQAAARAGTRNEARIELCCPSEKMGAPLPLTVTSVALLLHLKGHAAKAQEAPTLRCDSESELLANLQWMRDACSRAGESFAEVDALVPSSVTTRGCGEVVRHVAEDCDGVLLRSPVWFAGRKAALDVAVASAAAIPDDVDEV